MGVLAIAVYKLVSNQKSLARVKGQISMRLLEIRLFSHDIAQVLRSTGAILVKNVLDLRNHMVPMVIMFVPFVVILAQLVAHYAYQPGADLARWSYSTCASTPRAGVSARGASLALPEGVSLDAPPGGHGRRPGSSGGCAPTRPAITCCA